MRILVIIVALTVPLLVTGQKVEITDPVLQHLLDNYLDSIAEEDANIHKGNVIILEFEELQFERYQLPCWRGFVIRAPDAYFSRWSPNIIFIVQQEITPQSLGLAK